MFPQIAWFYILHINTHATHNSSIRADEGLALEISAVKVYTMANLHYQLSS